jgi:general secretion pathway protein E
MIDRTAPHFALPNAPEPDSNAGLLAALSVAANGAPISSADLEAVRQAAISEGRSLLSVLLDRGLVAEEAAARALALTQKLSLAGPNAEPVRLPPDLRINPAFLEAHEAFVSALTAETLTLVCADPQAEGLRAGLNLIWPHAILIEVAPRGQVREALRTFGRTQGGSTGAGSGDASRADNAEGARVDAPAVRYVNDLVGQAARLGASDIHIQPLRRGARVRARVDGVLQDLAPIEESLAVAVLARIKVMAGLDIAERRLPQDGRFSLRVEGETYDVRTACVPSADGESITLRLLRDSPRAVSLDEIGLNASQTAILTRALAQPQGLILATGPTGSGKTTTLAAAVGRINDPSRKIVSIEDPVEYRIDGVTQIPVRANIGLSFAAALRSVLRSDPDIIVVGELRDAETAQIACNAALTGHLVLATLHTVSAAGAALRLLDLGVEPGVARSVLRLVIDQRLLRRLVPEAEQADMAPAEIEAESFRGRIGAFELLEFDDTLGDLISRRAPVSEIEQAARRKGVPSLYADARAKIAAGLTTKAEVVRVLGPDDDAEIHARDD